MQMAVVNERTISLMAPLLAQQIAAASAQAAQGDCIVEIAQYSCGMTGTSSNSMHPVALFVAIIPLMFVYPLKRVTGW